MEDMLLALEGPGLLDGHEIRGFLHHADQPAITLGILTDAAGIGFRKGETTAAQSDAPVQLPQIPGQALGLAGWPPQDMESEPGRGFHADSRQPVQVGNKAAQSRRNDVHMQKVQGER